MHHDLPVGTPDSVIDAAGALSGAYGSPLNVGGGLHSPFGAAGPPATITGWPFRSMSTTVTQPLLDTIEPDEVEARPAASPKPAATRAAAGNAAPTSLASTQSDAEAGALPSMSVTSLLSHAARYRWNISSGKCYRTRSASRRVHTDIESVLTHGQL